MTLEGWVKTYRKIIQNDLWKDKPFARGQAWIDMIMLAGHKDTEFLFDGCMLQLKRGEFVTSKRKLAERWGWSRSKVTKFLDELNSVQMCVAKSDSKKTTIKIVKYEEYQGFESIMEVSKKPPKKPQKSHRSATEKPLKDTINNVNNIKNDKEVKEEPAALSDFDKECNEILGYLIGDREPTEDEYRKLGYS